MRRAPSLLDRRVRAGRFFGVGLLAAVAMSGEAGAAETTVVADVVRVLVDNAKLIRMPEKTSMVVVGNPAIADVTLQRNGVLILTGKSYGTTNLIALDDAGSMIAESMIRVEAPRASTVTVQRGLDRESYSCTPNCQPSAQLGDSTKWFTDVSMQADKRRQLATSGTGPLSGPASAPVAAAAPPAMGFGVP